MEYGLDMLVKSNSGSVGLSKEVKQPLKLQYYIARQVDTDATSIPASLDAVSHGKRYVPAVEADDLPLAELDSDGKQGFGSYS